MKKTFFTARLIRDGFIFLLLFFGTVIASAQIYRVRDIQYDSLNPSGPSPFVGQYVHVAAIVTGTLVNIGAGGNQSFFIQDRDTTGFHGIFIRNSTNRSVAVGDSVIVGGRVQNANGQNQIYCASNDTTTILSRSVWRPTGTIKTLDTLTSTTSAPAWVGMLVKVRNVRVTSVAADTTYIMINDGSGSIQVDGGSSAGRWSHGYQVGDSLRSITGNILETSPGVYVLEPRSDADFIGYGNNPPEVTNVAGTPATPTPYERVTFGAHVRDNETTVSAVWLDYFVNGVHQDSIRMSTVAGATDSFSISAGPWGWGATVRYRVKAMDDQGAVGVSTDQTFSINFARGVIPFQYIVDHPDTFLTLGRAVTLEGLVVYAQGHPTSSSMRTDAYIIDTTSGIGMYISEASAPSNYVGLVRGNYIRIPATFSVYGGAFELGGSAGLTLVASNLPLPRPVRLRTGDYPGQHRITATANPYYFQSGTFVEFTGRVMSVDPSTTGVNMTIDDGSGTGAIRIWDPAHLPKVATASGDTIPLTKIVGKRYTIKGVASRYNTDFQMVAGYIEDFVEQDGSIGATNNTTIQLLNNIDGLDLKAGVLVNDLNEQIKIRYGAPFGSRVQVRVFNIKGQVVATLIDKTSGGISETVWDGRSDLGEKLPLGTYIVQVESNNKGTTKTAIAPVVIGTKL